MSYGFGSKVGTIALGTNKGSFTLYKESVWNNFDDLALYRSLTRRPNEKNIPFRNRIVNSGKYNSTIQGVTNLVCDVLDYNKFFNKDKTIFLSSYVPLSYNEYIKYINNDVEYIPPSVECDGLVYSFPEDMQSVEEFYSTSIKDRFEIAFAYIKVFQDDKSWTLWKQINQSFSQIFQCSYAPKEYVRLKYQTFLNNEIVYIEEDINYMTKENDIYIKKMDETKHYE